MVGITLPLAREKRVQRGSRRGSDSQLLAAAAAATAALELLNQGVVLIDGACRVSFASSLAKSICRETDGLTLRGDQLIAVGKPDSARLNCALRCAVNGGQDTSMRLERPQRRPVSLLIVPLPLRDAYKGVAAALVLINDPDRAPAPPKERLIQAYGLTGAEAGVAQLMLRGAGISVVARRLNISVETARTHLRRLLTKTGTHRQSDLILLLLREVGGIV